MGLKLSNAEASGTTVGRKLSKKNLMGFYSAGTPTKQGSKLGILEYTYTKAMPSTHTHTQTLKKKIDRATVKLATAKANLLHDDCTKRGERKNTRNK